MGKRRGKGAFVKVQKNKAYFKRFQVKPRRRREGKTDYYQRKKLIIQAKNKYETPKYRLIVRSTNTQIICQVAYSTLTGDHIIASAYSKELERYGLKVGFANYSAAYCTGLLVGRRVLKKLGLDELYTGVGNDEEDEVTGEIEVTEFGKKKYFVDEVDEEKRPFRCFLDVGLARTSLGAKVFGALKGASDAGLDIPHNYKKFPGYDPDEKTYDASEHRDKIFGEPVAEYMRFLQQEDEESGTKRLEEQFKSYVAAGISADDLEDLYASVHKKIREDPSPKYDKTHKERVAAGEIKFDKKYKKKGKDSKEERDARVQAKRDLIAQMEEDESSDEEEETEE
eukprot:augustus_masked-scaffold_18-processed-gene-3.18-mRNA-1 protein AED:0.19 eAED:0.20 QI:0/-1/0/1/-1/1/1/0/338